MLIILAGERPWSWNKMYSGIHWTARAKEAARIHELVWVEFLENHRDITKSDQIFKNRVDIEITVYFENQPTDSDNICEKFYIDGLIGYVIADDTREYVRKVSTQSEIDKDNPRVTGKVIVFAWVKIPDTETYHYKFIWGGGSIIKGLWKAWQAKSFSGCVKIEWRGVR